MPGWISPDEIVYVDNGARGAGGHGAVREARYRGTRVACKTLFSESSQSTSDIALELTAMLHVRDHDNIVRPFGWTEKEGKRVIVMSLTDGR